MNLIKFTTLLFSVFFSAVFIQACGSIDEEEGFVTVGNLDLTDIDNTSLIRILIVDKDDFRHLYNKICNDNITSPFELQVRSEDSVKEVPATSMYGCKMLRRVVFDESSITTIGEGAFKGIDKLVSFIPPKSLEIIGASAFSDNKNLAIFTFTENIQTIGNNAFAGTGIETISFPKNTKLRTIGDASFINTEKLIKITIPNTVELIDKGAFQNSTIQEISFQESSDTQSSDSTGSNNSTKLTIEDNAFSGCTKLQSSITFPDHLVRIGNDAFSSTIIKTIDFNATSKLETIGKRAFSNNNSIELIRIPGSVKKIEDGILFQNKQTNNINLIFDSNPNGQNTWKLSSVPSTVTISDPNNYDPTTASADQNLQLFRSSSIWTRNVPDQKP